MQWSCKSSWGLSWGWGWKDKGKWVALTEKDIDRGINGTR